MSQVDQAGVDHLDEQHKQQVLAYLKYFRSKRDQHVRETESVFTDVKETRLLEDMYSQDDVVSVLDGLRDVVKSNIQSELDSFAHRSVLFLRQLFLQAEAHSVQLKMDTSVLDDDVLLSGIKNIDLNQEAKSDRKDVLPDAPLSKPKLQALQGAVDVKLVTRVKDLEEANERANTRFNKLQTQCKDLLQENSELKSTVTDLTEQQLQLRHQSSAQQQESEASQHDQLARLKAELKEKTDKLQALERQLLDKVQNTPQFVELKKMVQKKNTLLRETRTRLSKYEQVDDGPQESD